VSLPWATAEAEEITGAFGDQFHPFVTDSETLEVSTHAFGIYRHWPMTVTNGETYQVQGIDLYRFRPAPGTLGNASVNAYEAMAYHSDGPSGLLNQSTCEWGAPVFISGAQLWGASNSVIEGVAGLNTAACTPDSCGIYLGVEPFSGATMDFHWRVGVNAYIAPAVMGGVPYFAGVTPAYLPVARADRYGGVTAAQATAFKNQVYVARDAMAGARWGGIALAAVGCICSILFFVFAYQRKRTIDANRGHEMAEYYANYYRPFLTDAAGADAAAAATATGAYAPLTDAATPSGGALVYPTVPPRAIN